MQKMRMLFALFIALPLLSLSLKPGYARNDFFNFVGELTDNIDVFKSITDEEKDIVLKDLNSSISDLNKEIKKYISEKKENPKDKIVDLVKKLLYINYYLPNRVCNKEDENCSNEKKRLMNNIVAVVEDYFGKCPVTLEYIYKLTNDVHEDLLTFEEIIQSIAENKDYIEKSKIDIVINLFNCLSDNLKDIMKIVYEKYAVLYHGHKPQVESFLWNRHTSILRKTLLKLTGSDGKEEEKKDSESNKLSFETREDVYEEIIDILKEIKESNKNKTLIIFISCLTTITILIGGFLLYRFIRRKNSNPFENIKDLNASENK